MKNTNLMTTVFAVITVVLMCASCVVVSYNYASMECAIAHGGASAPIWIVFVAAIPYGIAVLASAILTLIFYKKMKKENKDA